MRGRLLLVLGIGLAVLGGGVWALRHRPLAVPVAQQEQDVPVRVFGLGTIEAQISSRIGFEVAGTLIELHADHGDRVAAGTVLARLNPAAQQARVAKAEAGLQSAEAQQLRVAAALERATATMERLNLPVRLHGLPPATFSGGEQQRVNLARGFVAPWPVLLLDEPTASLDAANREVVVGLIEQAKAEGSAVVGISPDADVRDRVATRLFEVRPV